MGELGLMGFTPPEEYGGSGQHFTSLCVAIEETGRVDQTLGITLEAAVGLGINPIPTFGSTEQMQAWLHDSVSGQSLAGFGLTEAPAESDAAVTRTWEELVASEWVVNREKQFIINSGSAITSIVTATARTGIRSDGKVPEVGEGISEVQRLIARSVALPVE